MVFFGVERSLIERRRGLVSDCRIWILVFFLMELNVWKGKENCVRKWLIFP